MPYPLLTPDHLALAMVLGRVPGTLAAAMANPLLAAVLNLHAEVIARRASTHAATDRKRQSAGDLE